MIQKKIRSLIFAGLGLVLCVLLCGGIGMTAQAESYGNLTYEENESGITITGYTGNKKKTTKLVIPEKIGGKKVTSIEEYAFSFCSGLTSITLPKSVTSIGEHAFESCSGLKSITLPDSVTSIGWGAFRGCSGLKSITIPKGVTSIEARTFEGCSGLTSITIPERVTSIRGWAFGNCSGLTSITIPKSVTSIGESIGDHSYNAFAGCSSLTSIKVSKENKYYDSRNDCNAIINTKSNTLVSGCENTVIPDSVTSIEIEAFYGCSGLKSITIPKGVTSIKNLVFYGCSGLTSITIPKGVTGIGDRAFGGCSGLTSITIPKSVTAIYDEIFPGCDNLVISCYKDSEIYKYAKTSNIPVKLIVDPAKKGTILTVSSKKLEVVVTSSSKKNPTVTVTKITDKKAKKLTIPDTVKVKGVTYKVTAVSDRAFKGNKKLTTVTIGSNVTMIGIGAFYGCKNLKKITVTAGKLTTINRSVFKGIKKNATITVKGTKKAKTALKKQLKKKSIGYVKTWKIK